MGSDAVNPALIPAAAPAVGGGRSATWRAIIAIALVLASFAAFWPGTLTLVAQWEDYVRRTYTHGYVVVAIALWLIWRERAAWARVTRGPSLAGFGMLMAGSIAWLVAYRAGIQIVHQALLPALVAAALFTAFGWQSLRRLWFAVAYLYLAIPVWDAVLPLLQSISVIAVRTLLRLVDVPAFFIGNRIEIASGAFEIADGCSGLHFFVVGLTVSLLYGEVNRDTWRVRLRLVALALALAMITNWLRIFIIVLAGHFTDMQHTLVANEHYSFGWGMFAGAMILYFLWVRRWPRSAPQPVTDNFEIAPGVRVTGPLLAALGLSIVPVWVSMDDNRASAAELDAMLPAGISSAPIAVASESWQPSFSGADRERFAAAPGGVDIYVASYAEQRQGKELGGYGTSLLGRGLRRIPADDAGFGQWNALRASDTSGHVWLIWYSYRLDAKWYRSALRLQLDYGLRSLFGAPAAAVVAVRSRCAGDDCGAARNSLQDFVIKGSK